jgi:mannose-6-phosphate isomerase-like protein (cupin superfamily)
MTNKGRIFNIDSLLNDLREQGGYFMNFFRVSHLEAGVIALKPGENDTQTPHGSDELYYIIRGSGFVQLGDVSELIRPGSIVFVPAKLKHKFYGNKDELVVLYFFGE